MDGKHKTPLRRKTLSWAVVAHFFNPSTWQAEAGEFKASLVYRGKTLFKDLCLRGRMWRPDSRHPDSLAIQVAQESISDF